MKPDYSDVIEAAGIEPSWFDESGVPRFCTFKPELAADPYAREVALVRIRCADCGTPFQVTVAHRGGTDKSVAYRICKNELEYGDAPNTGCCDAGYCTCSETTEVIEYWKRNPTVGWLRIRSLEGICMAASAR
jgi:hypothetical protein